MEHIVFGLCGGLLGAIYLTIFFAALRSKSWLGLTLFLGFTLLMVLPSKLALSWFPDPTTILDSWGLNASADLSRPGILSLMLTMVGGVALAHFSGLINWVSRVIDRLGAAITARLKGPENPTDLTGN